VTSSISLPFGKDMAYSQKLHATSSGYKCWSVLLDRGNLAGALTARAAHPNGVAAKVNQNSALRSRFLRRGKGSVVLNKRQFRGVTVAILLPQSVHFGALLGGGDSRLPDPASMLQNEVYKMKVDRTFRSDLVFP
jgi:hypothetical protein